MLAGGYGSRLFPLTQVRSKPAVPFAGTYRIVDFSLSNCVNSGFRKIYVLTQYKSQSLTEHIMNGWSFLSRDLGEFISIVPPQLRNSDKWYQGTADAIFQNINLLDVRRPKYVLIVSADHIYNMDYQKMLKFHIEKGADLTIAALEVSKEDAKGFGVIGVDDKDKIIEFQEKPENPNTLPNNPDISYASMGIYIFSTEALVRALSKDAKKDSSHDFGKNIIPNMLTENKSLSAYSFTTDEIGKGYWKDVGTTDSYFKASMDILDGTFEIDNKRWPIYTDRKIGLSSKISLEKIKSSSFSHSCNIDAKELENSIISNNVSMESGVSVKNSIIFENVKLGKEVRIKNTIIDKNCEIKDGIQIGYNKEEDKKRFIITDKGIIVVPKDSIID
jgi:glucose-1-phosphate adenylyltransferase